ncbi:FAD:protein FMN transferase [Bacteroidota bacterium]
MRKTILWTAILLPVLFQYACQEEVPGAWIKLSGYTQGTTYNITYQSPDSTNYQENIETILAGFDLSLSTYMDSSLISRFNQGEMGLNPDTYFETCFNCAEEVNKATGGAFDITIAPVVNAWGFGFTEAAEVDSFMISSLLEYVGMEKVGIEEGIIVKHKDGVMLDMNAIAQGYSVDVLAGFLEGEGLKNYLVEIGGEVKTRGRNPRGTGWKVGIDRPIEGLQIPGVDLQAIIEITDLSLATSGNYRKFYEKNGMKYSHTIDPKTGYPVHHGLLSATVLADDCMRADAYATSFMVMGFEKSREFLINQDELDVYLIYNNEEGEYSIWYTDGLEDNLIKGKD